MLILSWELLDLAVRAEGNTGFKSGRLCRIRIFSLRYARVQAKYNSKLFRTLSYFCSPI